MEIDDAIPIKKHLAKLGLRARDKVTGMTGVITNIGFDLYGCVQAIVHPGLNEKGELRDTMWFDIERLEILKPKPVMDPPNFDYGRQAEGKQGAGEMPRMNKA